MDVKEQGVEKGAVNKENCRLPRGEEQEMSAKAKRMRDGPNKSLSGKREREGRDDSAKQDPQSFYGKGKQWTRRCGADSWGT